MSTYFILANWTEQGIKDIKASPKRLRATKRVSAGPELVDDLERLRAPDAPELREIGVFVIPADTGFDPLASRTPMRGVRPAATGLLREVQPSPNAC